MDTTKEDKLQLTTSVYDVTVLSNNIKNSVETTTSR